MSKETVIAFWVVLFFIISWGLGAYFTRWQRSLGAYFVAGKGLPPFVLALAGMAAGYSGWIFVGTPGLLYGYGTTLFATNMGWLLIGPYYIWIYVAGHKMRTMADTHNAHTLSDLIYYRFRSQGLRMASGGIMWIGSMFYICTQVMATGYIMEIVFHLPFWVGVIIAFILCGSYTVLGGMLASSYVSVFQGILMWLIMVIGGIVIITVYNGGVGPMYEAAYMVKGAMYVSPKGYLSTMYIITYTMVNPIAGWGFATLLGRYATIRSVPKLRHVPLMQALISIGIGFFTLGVAWGHRIQEYQGVLEAVSPNDRVSPSFVFNVLPGSWGGVVFAGVFAAIMSTVSILVMLGSGAITKDIMIGGLGMKLSHRAEINWARIWGLVTLFLPILLALTIQEYIIWVAAVGTTIWAMVFLPGAVFSLIWRRMSRLTMWIIVIIAYFTVPFDLLKMYGLYSLPYGMKPAGLTFLIVIVVAIVTPFIFDGRKQIPADMEKIMAIPWFTMPSRKLVAPAA